VRGSEELRLPALFFQDPFFPLHRKDMNFCTAGDDPEKLFMNTPRECLLWEYRYPRIIREIVRWSPDVVTLEECDMFEVCYPPQNYFCQTVVFDKIHQDIQKSLADHNYEGTVNLKDWSPIKKIGDHLPPDGVAIFYKTDKFQTSPDTQPLKLTQEKHKVCKFFVSPV